jgi:peptide deformylase
MSDAERQDARGNLTTLTAFLVELKEHIGSIGNGRWRYVVGMSLTTLLISLVLTLFLHGSAEPSASNVLAPVLPGTTIEECKPIDLRNIKQLSLDFLDDLVKSTAENHMSMATAQHFGMKYCVVVLCSEQEACLALLNPKITNIHSPAAIKHEDPLLCRNPVAVQTKRYRNIDVEWYDREGQRFERHFEKPLSYQLQHMFDVLSGNNVCG